ncbi:MAG: efflux RND transporter periplasmic adaptor subunit [Planctomycetota bacterium]
MPILPRPPLLPLRRGMGLALLLLAAPALGGCSRPAAPGSPATSAAGGARAREIPKVRVVRLERREMRRILDTMTKLESELEVALYPRTAGTVVELRVEEGDVVGAGDVLARLDDRDQVLAERDAEVAREEAGNAAELARLAVDEAKARMESAELASRQTERDYERNLQLFEGRETTSPVSKSALEASELARDRAGHDLRLATLAWQKSQLDLKAAATAVERAAVALDRARVALSYCQITAPFAGVIAERRIRIGDSAGTGQAAFVLTDPANLRTVFHRPQEELALFRGAAGDGPAGVLEVTATAEALPGEVFTGEVERISPTIDPDSGQFRVTARLRAADGSERSRLLPGMLVRIEIVTDRHPDAVVLPKRALRREGERRFVYVVEPPAADADAPADVPPPPPGESFRTIHRVDIAEGYSDEESVEIAAVEGLPLREGQLVVLVGSRDLDDGDLVDVDLVDVEDEAPAAEGNEEVARSGEPAASPAGTDGGE